MPTYEYVCDKCGHHFEVFQSMRDPPLRICPQERCARNPWAKGKVKKQISAGAGLIFKGSGFYTTDYRSEKYREAAKKETSSTSASSPSTDGAAKSNHGDTKKSSKPESKPATPPTKAAS